MPATRSQARCVAALSLAYPVQHDWFELFPVQPARLLIHTVQSQWVHMRSCAFVLPHQSLEMHLLKEGCIPQASFLLRLHAMLRMWCTLFELCMPPDICYQQTDTSRALQPLLNQQCSTTIAKRALPSIDVVLIRRCLKPANGAAEECAVSNTGVRGCYVEGVRAAQA